MENQDRHCCCGCADVVENNRRQGIHTYIHIKGDQLGKIRPIVFLAALHYRLHLSAITKTFVTHVCISGGAAHAPCMVKAPTRCRVHVMLKMLEVQL